MENIVSWFRAAKHGGGKNNINGAHLSTSIGGGGGGVMGDVREGGVGSGGDGMPTGNAAPWNHTQKPSTTKFQPAFSISTRVCLPTLTRHLKE